MAALTDFGKEIRKARIDTGETLGSMADALKVTPAFLSSVETGRKKVPTSLVQQIQAFFQVRGKKIGDLAQLADIANKAVSLEGLSPQHQMLVAGFARSSLDADTLEKMAALLASANKPEKK